MDLLFDLGHSRLKWAYWADGRLHTPGAVGWRDRPPVSVFEQLFGDLKPPRRVAVAAVARGEPLQALQAAVRARWGLDAQLPPVTARCGQVRCGYVEPGRLGFDRWAALIGAWARQPGRAAVVIDCGSAVTVDALAADGQHLGGVIIPGIDMMADAFYARTGLPRDAVTNDHELSARCTADAVASGARIAVLGGIELALRRWAARLPDATQWLTGGAAPALAADLPATLLPAPHLVLEGLGRILDGEGG